MSKRRRLVALGAGMALLLAGLGGYLLVRPLLEPCRIPVGMVRDWHSLSCHPETHLRFPTSTNLRPGENEGGQNEEAGIPPTQAEYVTSWLEESATPQQVQDWLGAQLTPRGWSRASEFDEPDNGTGWTRNWTRGPREHMTILIYTQPSRYIKNYAGSGFVYELLYSIKPTSFYTEWVPF